MIAPTRADPKGPIVGALARFVLVAGGGAAVGAGVTFYLMHGQIPPISFGGAASTIGGLAWSLWHKLNANARLDAAIRAPAVNPTQTPKGPPMPLSQTIDAGIAALERLFGALPPELQADAAKAAADLRTTVTAEAATAIQQAAPAFAPELVPLLSEALDAMEAKAAAKLAAVQSAKAALTPTS